MDYHVHSTHSCDGRSSIFEMCRKAVDLGITEIGFSEHVDFDPADWGFGFFNYERYSSEIKRTQEFFKNTLVIRKGVEMDYQYCFEEDIKEWLQDKRFDFIIGSVHYINHEIICRRLVTNRGLTEIYDAYLEEVNCSIRSGLFDVIGHLDLVRRYVDSKKLDLDETSYWGNMKRTLREITEQKVYLEINSKGLRETYGDTIPSREIVSKYVDNGGKLVSVGSDAHSTEELGTGIHEIFDFLADREERLILLFEQE